MPIRIAFREWSLFLAILLTSLPATSETIDLRNQSEAGDYEVAFCARPSPNGGLPGHAFVSFSSTNPGQQRDFISVGHTPSQDSGLGWTLWSRIGRPVNGVVAEERYTSVSEQCLQVKVNRATYAELRQRTVDPFAIIGFSDVGTPVVHPYKLGIKDCVAFAITAARHLQSLGMQVPDRHDNETPVHYIERLIEANRPRTRVPSEPTGVSAT